MARPALSALALATLALVDTACDRLPGRTAPSAVTVRLPPPRPAAPAPAFKPVAADRDGL